MSSAHFGVDHSLGIGSSHLTLNFVTEEVKFTRQNELALIGFAVTLEVIVIITVTSQTSC